MSVVITLKMNGDTAKFRQSLVDRGEEFAAIGKRAQSVGAIHHRFAVGDGFVLVVDEWESPASFESFFSDPELQEFIGQVGGDTSAPPEITVAQAVPSPDEF